MTAAKPARSKSAQPRVAPAGSQAPSADEPTPKGKSIFLFSDGTGNSSAKLFKTNVWRMYEAIDFGLASPGKRVQIGYYDNGVGTSAFRPLALLGGIFGIGLTSNVMRLYAFLCRNYQPGDRIYAFGFSRGAFTIRLLVALIASQGVLCPDGDTPLSYQVRDAYRAFRRTFRPNRWIGRVLVAIGRALRDQTLSAKRRIMGQVRYRHTRRLHPDVEFVGVWDTVAAYGGPFAELTRGIDDWVFPLTMPEYGLSPKVKKARHALSLDDERDAFWPLLWDEVREADMVLKGAPVVVGQFADGSDIMEIRRIPHDRLKQVWFAGVHSDVGGGYPDESLSYISLLWMMDELGDDVDFLASFVQRAQDLANPYGPIHDSRKGPAAYYRYQPRKILAFMHPPSPKTLSLRPPERSKDLGEHGLLRSVCIHESAIARIISGIDKYAPSALPGEFDIVRAKGRFGRNILTEEDNEILAEAERCQQLRFELQENHWDKVWRRRLLYFLTVGVTLLLVAAPWLPKLKEVEDLCSDDRCFARSFVDVALFFLPQSIRNSLDPWASLPLLVIGLGLLILVFIAIGQRTERRFRDSVRKTWHDYLRRDLNHFPGVTGLREIREKEAYQRPLYWLKWGVLPAVFGLLTLAAIAYALVIAATQILYARVESRSTFCKPPRQATGTAGVSNVYFDTANSCTDLGLDVTPGSPYRMTIRPIAPFASGNSPWSDGGLLADPRRGVTSKQAYMTLFAPLKRVTSANWMQVLTQVRATEAHGDVREAVAPIFGMPIDMRRHRLDFDKATGTYSTVFCVPWKGRLYVMVNDAAPLLSKRFYANNVGTAEVTVEPAPDKQCTR